jgi:hypothetical protein
MCIISLSGLKGSGKDTVAEFLVTEKGFVRLSFASALKDVLSILFHWNRKVLDGNTPEDRIKREEIDPYWSKKLGIPNFSMRKAMTLVGTDVFRNHFNENIWVYQVEREILNLLERDPNTNIVISDTRFVNEITMLKSLGAKTVLVQRQDPPEWYQSALEYNRMKNKEEARMYIHSRYEKNIFTLNIHPSEWELVGYEFDFVIENNSTIEALNRKVQDVIL